jgi:hypothetical protein
LERSSADLICRSTIRPRFFKENPQTSKNSKHALHAAKQVRACIFAWLLISGVKESLLAKNSGFAEMGYVAGTRER